MGCGDRVPVLGAGAVSWLFGGGGGAGTHGAGNMKRVLALST